MGMLLRGRAGVATDTLDISALKARQSVKICELRGALVGEGFRTLDEQAQALGLCRSTAWTILKGQHKSSGLSATIINRILTTPQLPQLVRLKILEYVAEKAAGLYGHSPTQQRRFVARLDIPDGEDANALAADADGVRGRLAIAERRKWKGGGRRSGGQLLVPQTAIPKAVRMG